MNPISIKNFNYSEAVNNRDIVSVKNEKGTYDKGFFVADNILVVPERYGDILSEEGGITPKNNTTEVRDKLYLTEETQKNEYLQIVTRILKRMNLFSSGNKLLNMLTKVEPLYEMDGSSYNEQCSSRYVEISGGQRRRVNVMITGPGSNLTEGVTIPYITPNEICLESLGLGSASTISITPKYEIAYSKDGGKSKNKYHADPMMSLYHELVHAMHNLYGMRFENKHLVGNVKLEEFVTFGGIHHGENLDSMYKDELLGAKLIHAHDEINKLKTKADRDDVKNIFENNLKLLLGKENISVNGDHDIVTLMPQVKRAINNFTEHGFAKEVENTFVRQDYLWEPGTAIPVCFNNFLEKYHPEKGFIKDGMDLYEGQNIRNKHVTPNPKTTSRKAKLSISCLGW